MTMKKPEFSRYVEKAIYQFRHKYGWDKRIFNAAIVDKFLNEYIDTHASFQGENRFIFADMFRLRLELRLQH